MHETLEVLQTIYCHSLAWSKGAAGDECQPACGTALNAKGSNTARGPLQP